jgi:hypothetical protein
MLGSACRGGRRGILRRRIRGILHGHRRQERFRDGTVGSEYLNTMLLEKLQNLYLRFDGAAEPSKVTNYDRTNGARIGQREQLPKSWSAVVIAGSPQVREGLLMHPPVGLEFADDRHARGALGADSGLFGRRPEVDCNSSRACFHRSSPGGLSGGR